MSGNDKKDKDGKPVVRFRISEDDIYEAMKDLQGYLDITPGDLYEIYVHAYRHAFERIRNSVRAADIMTMDVLTAFRETPLGEVAELMASRGISGLPVVDGERRVIGVLSEKDFSLRMGDGRSNRLMAIVADCIRSRGCAAMTIRGKTAGDIMTAPAIVVGEDAVVGDITALLAEKNINRVPVVDRAGRLKGIISRADIVRITFEKPE